MVCEEKPVGVRVPVTVDDCDVVREAVKLLEAEVVTEHVPVTELVGVNVADTVNDGMDLVPVAELLPDDVVLRVAVADDDIVMVPIVAVEVRDGDMVDETDTDTEALVVPLRVDVKEMNVILSEVSVKL
jgi:hypothetical protein